MAISRSLMNRQLQANGGIMNVSPREKFGLGSSLKKWKNIFMGGTIAVSYTHLTLPTKA